MILKNDGFLSITSLYRTQSRSLYSDFITKYIDIIIILFICFGGVFFGIDLKVWLGNVFSYLYMSDQTIPAVRKPMFG